MENTITIPIVINLDFLHGVLEQVIQANLKELRKADKTREKDEILLSREQIAKYLGTSTATISNYIRDGLPFLKLKRRPYFKVSEVEAYMAKKTPGRKR
jgi:excisionase family DNA binding protein